MKHQELIQMKHQYSKQVFNNFQGSQMTMNTHAEVLLQ